MEKALGQRCRAANSSASERTAALPQENETARNGRLQKIRNRNIEILFGREFRNSNLVATGGKPHPAGRRPLSICRKAVSTHRIENQTSASKAPERLGKKLHRALASAGDAKSARSSRPAASMIRSSFGDSREAKNFGFELPGNVARGRFAIDICVSDRNPDRIHFHRPARCGLKRGATKDIRIPRRSQTLRETKPATLFRNRLNQPLARLEGNDPVAHGNRQRHLARLRADGTSLSHCPE